MFETGKPLVRTRSLFLRIISLCYGAAFSSLYTQIEGLYGDTGIVPIANTAGGITKETFFQDTTVLWIGKYLDIKPWETMELLCIVGVVISTLSTLWLQFAGKLSFFVMWICYLSIFKVGQTFLWFQWDILLLEVGFLAIIVSPTFPSTWHLPRPRDHVCMMLVRWLLFRMMFASGVVKLQSGCPHWWGLTAMPLHYESQCIPNYLSWFAYNIFGEGDAIHKLSVVVTYITEIPMTLFFFSPTKLLRMISFVFQVNLMVAIILTGNYNFFNILYIALCVSLLDDGDLRKQEDQEGSWLIKIFLRIINLGVIAALGVGCYQAFSKDNEVKVNFTMKEFNRSVTLMTKWGLGLGAASMAYSLVLGLAKVISPQDEVSRLLNSNWSHALKNLLSLIVHGVLAVFMFAVSVPVFLNGVNQSNLVSNFRLFDQTVDQLSLVHSYGLFRHMTGEGGRPEVIIEGSETEHGPWEEYHFLYKPGNLTRAPDPFIIPHQPRLDWQMWFAALGSYRQNPWLVSTVFRLLKGEKSVLRLLDRDNCPFKRKPPTHMRVRSFRYHFTGPTNKKLREGGDSWWWRDGEEEYLPFVALDVSGLEDYIESLGFDVPRPWGASRSYLGTKMATLRDLVTSFKPHLVVWTIFASPLFVLIALNLMN